MTHPSLRYASYLVRIWPISEGDPHSGRVYLQDLTTGQRTGFVTLAALFAFLELASAAPSSQADGATTKETYVEADCDVRAASA